MSQSLHYETPENVQIVYRPAGLGTRFLAWFLDGIILTLTLFILVIVLVIFVAAADSVMRDVFDKVQKLLRSDDKPVEQEKLVMYLVGAIVLIWGFSGFAYFGLSELLMRGQTVGKRICGIRVVKVDGFSLDLVSVFLRNMFRLIDNFSILWLVPFLSKRSQRFGDMVAGTIVVSDTVEELSAVRHALLSRNQSEAKFRFDQAKLSKLSPDDYEAMERILDAWSTLTSDQQNDLLNTMIPRICARLEMGAEPAASERLEFLEDLLSAEFRRQDRQLR